MRIGVETREIVTGWVRKRIGSSVEWTTPMKLQRRDSVRRLWVYSMNGDTMNTTCTHTDNPTASIEPLDNQGIIPFADECTKQCTKSGQTASKPEAPAPQRDSAMEAFGPVRRRPSLVDRELGIDRLMTKRRGKYSCPCCGHATSRVMRVRVSTQPGWSAVCAVCAATLLAKIPGTIVGGMVRPTRRRRSRLPGQVAHGFRRMDQNSYRRAG